MYFYYRCGSPILLIKTLTMSIVRWYKCSDWYEGKHSLFLYNGKWFLSIRLIWKFVIYIIVMITLVVTTCQP